LKSKGFWNVPNSLTVLRICMVPVMVWLLWDAPTPSESAVATAIFAGAMITDIIDGYLARKWDLISPIGAYLDPLADKLMVVTTMIMLVPLGWMPAWLVVLLECRELAITGLRGIASQEGMVLSAGTLGKFKTAYQSTALSFLVFHHPFFGMDTHSIGMVLMWIATIFSLVSGGQYLWQFFRSTRLTA
jgi:CDP-diacylglycerol---glycerol-3-phosphate 3-phosphatidyltransferase